MRRVPFVARPGHLPRHHLRAGDRPAGRPARRALGAWCTGAPTRRSTRSLVDLQRPGGGWERSAAAARDSAQSLAALGFEAQPILARTLRLSYDLADPPNAPFTVMAVEAVPAALAIPPTVRPPLWLVYGDFAVPAPPGLPRDDLRAVRRLAPLALGAPQANPWFAEKVLGTTWLRRRPAVLTVAMVVVLAIVAAVVSDGTPQPAAVSRLSVA